MKRYLILILLIAGFLLIGDEVKVKELPGTYPKVMYGNGMSWKVTDVVSGGTFKIEDYNDRKRKITVRLIGVDAPETYEKEAHLFLRNLLIGESVYLVAEPGMVKDKGGQTLAYVFRAPDGMFVNLETIRQGYAHVDGKGPLKHMEVFSHYEKRAKKLKKGLWSDDVVTAQKIEVTEPAGIGPVVPKKEPAENPENKTSGFAIVYKTKTGKKFHNEACRKLEGKKKVFTSKKIASEEGLAPCPVCKP